MIETLQHSHAWVPPWVTIKGVTWPQWLGQFSYTLPCLQSPDYVALTPLRPSHVLDPHQKISGSDHDLRTIYVEISFKKISIWRIIKKVEWAKDLRRQAVTLTVQMLLGPWQSVEKPCSIIVFTLHVKYTFFLWTEQPTGEHNFNRIHSAKKCILCFTSSFKFVENVLSLYWRKKRHFPPPRYLRCQFFWRTTANDVSTTFRHG